MTKLETHTDKSVTTLRLTEMRSGESMRCHEIDLDSSMSREEVAYALTVFAKALEAVPKETYE